MILLAIDSSIANIGYAVFDDSYPIDKARIASGTLRIPKMDETEKVREIFIVIKELINRYNCQEAIIEKPERFSYGRSTNLYGRGKNLESLRLNNLAVGIISGTCQSEDLKIVFVTPREWKGKQPKEVTRMWVNDLFGLQLEKKNYDESDALKIGAWHIERKRFDRLKRGVEA